jgi:transcriptional regulator with XRE-family HTH domain
MEPMINAHLLRERRLELGLSARELGRRVGLREVTVLRLEAGGAQDALRLDTFARVARELHLRVDQLLVSRPAQPTAATRNDVRLEAAILHSRRRRPLADFEIPLGLTSRELRQAADQLERRLDATGGELRRVAGGFTITARHGVLSRAELDRLRNTRRERQALRGDQVRALHDVINGSIDEIPFDGGLCGGSRPATIGYLLKHGYITERNGRYVPTQAVRFSLVSEARTDEVGVRLS